MGHHEKRKVYPVCFAKVRHRKLFCRAGLEHHKEKKMTCGKKIWVFPDAELPPVGANEIPGHESIIITNASDENAVIKNYGDGVVEAELPANTGAVIKIEK